MTRRERLERKAENRRQWAESRRRHATESYEKMRSIIGNIPMGQPVLVGHHSERRHRRELERADSAMAKCSESYTMAKHHDSKADGLESQLETSIFSDDADAVEQLEKRVAELETARDQMKRANAAYRKGGDAALAAMFPPEQFDEITAGIRRRGNYGQGRQPFESYTLTNLGARIRTARQRIEQIKRQNERAKQAEAAGGRLVKIHENINWAVVTFAEKPEREVLEALRSAGYSWRGGSWQGYADKLPECLK